MRLDAIRKLWERLRASNGKAEVLDTDSFTESERALGRMALPLITELAAARQTIAALTEKALAVDALLRLMPSPALLVDDAGQLLSSNDAAKALFGGPAVPVSVVALAARALRAGEERDCLTMADPLRAGALIRIVPADVEGSGVVFLIAPEGETSIDPAELIQRLGLTPMQARVVALVARGLSNREIGNRLGLSVETVRKHLTASYQKTGVVNRAAVVALAHGARFGARPPAHVM